MWGQWCSRHEEGTSLLHFAASHFQDAKVVEGLGVVVVCSQSEPETLVSQTCVPDGQPNMTDVIPNVTYIILVMNISI